MLGFYLFIVHVLTRKAHFLRTALFRDRNLVLSTVMSFALGFVLLPTLALTSPMLEELLNYPVETTGYMTIPRGVSLLGIDSVYVPQAIRREAWARLARDLDRTALAAMTTTIGLEDISAMAETMAAGGGRGRTVIDLAR